MARDAWLRNNGRMPLSNSTLEDLEQDGAGLMIFCLETYGVTPCNSHHKADLKKMIARYGKDQSYLHDSLKGKVWCPRCGSMNVGIMLTAPTHTPEY